MIQGDGATSPAVVEKTLLWRHWIPPTNTGYIEGFFGTENGKENGIKSTKSISNFCV